MLERICSVCGAGVPEGEESCPSCGTYYVESAEEGGEAESRQAGSGPSAQAVGEADQAALADTPAAATEPIALAGASALPEAPGTPAEKELLSQPESLAKPVKRKKKAVPAAQQTASREEKESGSAGSQQPHTPPPPVVPSQPETPKIKTAAAPARKEKPKPARRRPTCGIFLVLAGVAIFGFLAWVNSDNPPASPAKPEPPTATIRGGEMIVTSTPVASPSLTKSKGAPLQTEEINQALNGCTTGNLRVRAQPNDDKTTQTVGWLVPDICLIFDGRNQAGVWLHIGEDQTVKAGWIVLKYVDLEGDIFSLPVLEAEATPAP